MLLDVSSELLRFKEVGVSKEEVLDISSADVLPESTESFFSTGRLVSVRISWADSGSVILALVRED